MEAKFYFDQAQIMTCIEEYLRRQFPGRDITVSGYIEDGAASVTVNFPADELLPVNWGPIETGVIVRDPKLTCPT